jgi:dCTP deaminase
MLYSDKQIKSALDSGRLLISPLEEDNIEPASIDLRLGETFKKVTHKDDWLTVRLDLENDALEYEEVSESVTIEPEEFVLATTAETVKLSDDIVAHVLGRSSLGRLGISIHQTAGYIDPGFEGQITLELSNHGPAPVRLASGDRICQLIVEELSSAAAKPYGHESSQYQNQSGPTESRMNFE